MRKRVKLINGPWHNTKRSIPVNGTFTFKLKGFEGYYAGSGVWVSKV